MWFGVVTIMGDLIRAGTQTGVFSRALAQGVVTVDVFDPRRHTRDRHQSVDDRPYGGGPGMVMMVEPLLAAIAEARSAGRARLDRDTPVVYLSPQGARLDQQMVKEFAEMPGLVLLSGRYEGIDERLIDTAVDPPWLT